MDILKISALILTGTILISCIPAFDKHIRTIITIGVCILVTVYVINYVAPVVGQVKSFAIGAENYNLDIIFKVLGVGIISQFVSDIAADSGNKALAGLMLFAGKAACLVIRLPVFMNALQIIQELVRGI